MSLSRLKWLSLVLVSVVGVALLAADNAKKSSTTSDTKKALLGVWEVVRTEIDGKANSEYGLLGLVFKEGKVESHTEGLVSSEEYSVDSSKSPKQIDFIGIVNRDELKTPIREAKGKTGRDEKPPARPKKGPVDWGIFSIDGDTLKICQSRANRPRPTSFETKKGDGRVLIELRRFEKPKTKGTEKID